MEWTIGKILQWGESYLKRYSPTSRLDIELLLAHTLQVKRIDLYLDFYRPLTQDELEKLRGFLLRRRGQEPVAYITGTKEFWSLEFKVNNSTLIPRPETELIVETAIQLLKKGNMENGACGATASVEERLRILDLGTGCGNLAIALSREFPSSIVISTDIDLAALRIAQENARAFAREERIYFINGDFFSPFQEKGFADPFHLIVSNPPYIPRNELDSLPLTVKNYEPRKALDGGSEGLDYIKLIVQKAPLFLCPNGYLLLEIGLNQADKVERLINDSDGWKDLKFVKDYQGIDRILSVAKQG